VYNDATISPLAFLAFAVILDCIEKGTNLGRISLETLAKRLRCVRKTAWTAVQQLERAGHIRNIAPRGACATYQVLTRVTDDTGRGVAAYTGSSVKNGADPCKNGPSTRVTGDTHPIRNPNLPKGDDLKKTTTAATLDELVDLLRRCSLSGTTAEEEAAYLVRRFPRQQAPLLGHLRDALDQKLENPIDYADRMTQRGETPRGAPLHA